MSTMDPVCVSYTPHYDFRTAHYDDATEFNEDERPKSRPARVRDQLETGFEQFEDMEMALGTIDDEPPSVYTHHRHVAEIVEPLRAVVMRRPSSPSRPSLERGRALNVHARPFVPGAQRWRSPSASSDSSCSDPETLVDKYYGDGEDADQFGFTVMESELFGYCMEQLDRGTDPVSVISHLLRRATEDAANVISVCLVAERLGQHYLGGMKSWNHLVEEEVVKTFSSYWKPTGGWSIELHLPTPYDSPYSRGFNLARVVGALHEHSLLTARTFHSVLTFLAEDVEPSLFRLTAISEALQKAGSNLEATDVRRVLMGPQRLGALTTGCVSAIVKKRFVWAWCPASQTLLLNIFRLLQDLE
ncbi:unnamed protein product [Mycena citricolor]|uniref:Uncharacterized protein n=1 Tax=Mycena citricolor TaxID=2018698 RepID=A0AAD2HUZ3_9AGAR|nr:unnamed protein product [Mycena citricolor]CAK5282749.1 unnamed protein product [Mycena citricolor]